MGEMRRIHYFFTGFLRVWHLQCGVALGVLNIAFLVARLSAQADSAYLLPRVDVKAHAARAAPVGAHVERLDSAQLAWHGLESAAEVLLRRSGFYVKTYGLGSLATTSARGGSGSQTAVVWNGLPLQSPMLGQLDFALLPALFADDLTIQYGTITAAWGSGAVGGAVLIDNTTNWQSGFSGLLRVGAGSFGWRQSSGTLRYARERWSASTRFFIEEAKNDFLYRPAPTLPAQKQTNARAWQQAVLQEIAFRTRPEGAILTLRTWWQNAFRQIPPTLTQVRSEAEQGDAVWRTALHWQKTGRQNHWEFRAAHFEEAIRYWDPPLRQDTRNHFRTLMSEGEWSRHIGARLRAQTVITCAHTRAQTPAYGTDVHQWRLALFSAWAWQAPRWQAQIDARLEHIDGSWAPFTPGVGGILQIASRWQANARIARHYRAPTLNDRHWRPGGNLELRPENGWSQEVGLTYRIVEESWQWRFSATAFQRRIQDWILWVRQAGQAFFSPQNIAEVWSRGAELRFEVRQKALWGQWQFALGYDYTRSTNERPVANPRIAAGSQLFYVPLHRVFAELSGHWRGLEIIVFQQYTGEVVGLNEPVPAFTVGSVRMQYHWHLGRARLSAFGHLENAWDAQYQVIERRPMPGRHLRIGCQIGL